MSSIVKNCPGHSESIDYWLTEIKAGISKNKFNLTRSEVYFIQIFKCPCIDSLSEDIFKYILDNGIALNKSILNEKGLSAFNSAIALQPSSSLAHQGRGIALLHLEQNKDALKAFSKAKELNPNYLEADQGIATTLLNMGKVKEALELFAKIEIEKENNPKVGPEGSWPKYQSLPKPGKRKLNLD